MFLKESTTMLITLYLDFAGILTLKFKSVDSVLNGRVNESTLNICVNALLVCKSFGELSHKPVNFFLIICLQYSKKSPAKHILKKKLSKH